MNRTTIFNILGGVFLAITLVSIADSLLHTEPQCEKCKGPLRITSHRDDERMTVTFYLCDRCGMYSYEHSFKDGTDLFPSLFVEKPPEFQRPTSTDGLPRRAAAAP